MKAKLLSMAVALVALATAAPALADGGGGAGGAQAGLQGSTTTQTAVGAAFSNQNAVNANVPVSIAGGNVTSGPSSATQTATSDATTDVSNKAKTDQDQYLSQNIGGTGCYAGCGGAGGFQAGVQNAQTDQLAAGVSSSNQNAVNANVPVSIAGGNVNSGPSSATQTASSSATTDVSNKAKTDQDQHLRQNVGGGSCVLGCGGAGGFQAGIQDAQTNQLAVGVAKSDQNAVNANVPVSIAGGNVSSGPSSATQTATSNATTDVSNKAKTDQDQHLSQNIGGGSCLAGCGGPGGFQLGVQKADTNQAAIGIAKSDQNAVNANVPVSIAGGNVSSGPSSATQTATSDATTDVSNKAKTDQDQSLHQNLGNKWCGCDGRDMKTQCVAGCGGAGGFQLGVQKADTNQVAAGAAFSNQNAVNSNTPVSTAGGNIYSGPSSATQTATSNATTDVSNKVEDRPGPAPEPEHRRGLVPGRLRRLRRLPGRRPVRRDEPVGARHLQERPERRERQRACLDRRREHLLRPEQRDADGDVECHHGRLEQVQDRPGPVAASGPGREGLRLRARTAMTASPPVPAERVASRPASSPPRRTSGRSASPRATRTP